jgi:PAS domain S-box-containing protein
LKNKSTQYIKSIVTEEQEPKIFSLMERMLNEIVIFSKTDYQLLYANTGALNCLGLNTQEIGGKKIHEILADHDEASIKKIITPLINGKKAKIIFYSEFIRKNQSRCPAEIHVQLIEYGKQEVFLAVVINLTERQRAETEMLASLKEKEILLKEIHHRVKNNLQIISSLLNLQLSGVTDEKVLHMIKESQNRIKSMALIHEKLYKKNNLSMIDFSEYLEDLVTSLILSYRVNTSNIDVRINTKQLSLNIDLAVSLGLCITELVSNCFKYAFAPDEKGIVRIELETENNILTLKVKDSGVKLPKEFDINATESLGLKLVLSLADQHHGIFYFEKDIYTTFVVQIPLKEDMYDKKGQGRKAISLIEKAVSKLKLIS